MVVNDKRVGLLDASSILATSTKRRSNIELELAYLAGIIDGEGTITLSRQHKTAGRCPVISVSNTDISIINHLVETFGGNIVTRGSRNEKHLTAYVWQIRGNAALDLLSKVKPYLRHTSKVERAGLLTAEYKSVTPRNGKYTPEMIRRKEEFEERFFSF